LNSKVIFAVLVLILVSPSVSILSSAVTSQAKYGIISKISFPTTVGEMKYAGASNEIFVEYASGLHVLSASSNKIMTSIPILNPGLMSYDLYRYRQLGSLNSLLSTSLFLRVLGILKRSLSS
jgi:hypothetical protein